MFLEMQKSALNFKISRVVLLVMFSIFGCKFLASTCFAEDSSGLINKANRFYQQKKYDEAIKLYNQAQIKLPDAAEINYNIGAAQYKKEDYASAVSFFEKATASRDKILESKANFNIGNAKYKLGKLKENTDLKETVNLLRQSLDYYKRAIELDSRDEDARINHELVEKELKTLLDKLKQKQEKKNEQSAQAEENQDQSGDKQQEKQGDSAQEQKTGEQNEEEAKVVQAKQAEEQKQDQAQESKAQSAEREKEMSEQEANMLLEGYRQEENSAGKLEDRKRGFSGDVLKDW